MTWLQITWFVLIGVLLGVYALLDGFDLGVGFWHLFTKKDKHRRILLNAIGPVWDGNEVWLLTGGGAIFAAFPPVYATVFSGFYLAMMLVLLALISRAVSLEFRSKVENPRWRATWDVAFSAGSVLAALLFGVALGNVLRGIPLDANENYSGTFFGLLNPYALVIGLLAVAMVATHGAIFIQLKAPGSLGERARSWAVAAGGVYLVLFLVASGWTLAAQPHLTANYLAFPVLFIAPVVGAFGIVGAIVFSKKGSSGKAFIASGLSVLAMLGTVGGGLFPRMVPNLGDLEHSLTISNSSSSELTLMTMFVLALIGVPIVIGYTIYAYRIFAGKVRIEEQLY